MEISATIVDDAVKATLAEAAEKIENTLLYAELLGLASADLVVAAPADLTSAQLIQIKGELRSFERRSGVVLSVNFKFDWQQSNPAYGHVELVLLRSRLG